MYNDRPWLTCQEAAVLLDKTPRHILNYIKSGKLSATRDDKKFYIEKQEFYRVFSDELAKLGHRKPEKLDEESTRNLLEEKNNYLIDMIREKSKQIDFLKEQLNLFAQEKSKMLDAINSHTRLLEHKQKLENPIIDASPSKSRWSKMFSKKD